MMSQKNKLLQRSETAKLKETVGHLKWKKPKLKPEVIYYNNSLLLALGSDFLFFLF